MATTRKRPWLAAALALPITGLGHVYLRRWKRAIGWVLVVAAATALFVPPGVVEGPFTLAGTSLRETAPVVSLVAVSAMDAYLLARRENIASEIHGAERCPHCYRELAADVGFCEWCGRERRE